MTRTPAPELSPAEAAIVARFDAASVPPECDPERVETVVGWIRERFPLTPAEAEQEARDLLAALPPSPTEEAVKRVEALAKALDREAETAERVSFSTVSANRRAAASRIRAALASPTPAPQGGEQR